MSLLSAVVSIVHVVLSLLLSEHLVLIDHLFIFVSQTLISLLIVSDVTDYHWSRSVHDILTILIVLDVLRVESIVELRLLII